MADGARELSADAFELLLRVLDSDRERAGEQYERIRGRLVSLFRWRACSDPDELADRTFDRVARRLAEGAEVRVADPYIYFHGVALNVLREHWRGSDRIQRPLDEVPHPKAPVQALESESDRLALRLATERRLDCMSKCLEKLPGDHRRLIEGYHAGGGGPGAHIASRKSLANDMRLPLNALRIRAYRIRRTLQTCLETCLQRTSAEPF